MTAGIMEAAVTAAPELVFGPGRVLELGLVLAGLAAAGILFRRFPKLPEGEPRSSGLPPVSVIIPARNEEETLPLLLADLKCQTAAPFEILCVDDDSADDTARVARAGGARVISVQEKPAGWIGKSWACISGARAAKGELLLFLDADVRLAPDGLARLLHAQQSLGGTVSVQPWHRTQKAYEQSSLMFNLLQIGANGAAMAEPVQMGLYGPVILMSPADYWQIGGHETVRGSIVEDVALGLALKQAGLPYKAFIGDESVAFRMYPGGFRSLIQGWTKNLASGAAKAPLHLLILTFLWITSMMSVPIQLIRYGILGEFQWMILYAALYLVWILFLVKTVPRIGRFRPWIIALYPVSLVLMVWVFAVSLFSKLSGRKVLWKGRAIDTGGKPCE